MLTDSLCKSAKCPEDKTFKRFADSEGMYLEVTKSGGEYSRLKYHRHHARTDGEALFSNPVNHPSLYVTQSRLATGDGFSQLELDVAAFNNASDDSIDYAL